MRTAKHQVADMCVRTIPSPPCSFSFEERHERTSYEVLVYAAFRYYWPEHKLIQLLNYDTYMAY